MIHESNHSFPYRYLGPIRMTPIFAFSYGISFAAIAAVIVHTVLYQGKEQMFDKSYVCHNRKKYRQTISILIEGQQ